MSKNRYILYCILFESMRVRVCVQVKFKIVTNILERHCTSTWFDQSEYLLGFLFAFCLHLLAFVKIVHFASDKSGYAVHIFIFNCEVNFHLQMTRSEVMAINRLNWRRICCMKNLWYMSDTLSTNVLRSLRNTYTIITWNIFIRIPTDFLKPDYL